MNDDRFLSFGFCLLFLLAGILIALQNEQITRLQDSVKSIERQLEVLNE